jgi:hypothetical protein|tara:strand:+ start:903 stop:1211 length:309 start_codon:yes stop_codon:yes gene_type:complete
MTTITSINILNNKTQLTEPKMGDKFTLDINLNDGQRMHSVRIGRKWIYFKVTFGGKVIKKSLKEGKRILHNRYWNAAKNHAWYWYCVSTKRKSLPKNWKEAY